MPFEYFSLKNNMTIGSHDYTAAAGICTDLANPCVLGATRRWTRCLSRQSAPLLTKARSPPRQDDGSASARRSAERSLRN